MFFNNGKKDRSICRTGAALLVGGLIVALAGCKSAPKPKDFSGRWQPVNELSDNIQAIPLYKKYNYEVMPIDGTLKSLVARWATDSRLDSRYMHCLDFTLPKGAKKIKTPYLDQALVELNKLYEGQNVGVSKVGNTLVVEGGYLSSQDSQTLCD